MKPQKLLGVALVTIMAFACSQSSKMGKRKEAEDGKIIGGTVKPKCTYPRKKYTKELDANLKANFDSLKKLPIGDVEAGVKTKVIQLAQNTPEGLDIDLILFHICEMANNLGFSKEQGEKLISQAIEAWKVVKGGKSINIINKGTNNGIMAETVNINQNTELPREKNYQFNDTSVLYNGIFRKTTEIRPLDGQWGSPFIGFPKTEDSTVNATVWNGLPQLVAGSGERDYFIEGKTIPFTILYIAGFTVTKENGYFFLYDKLPSYFAFGDMNNSKRQYLVKLIK